MKNLLFVLASEKIKQNEKPVSDFIYTYNSLTYAKYQLYCSILLLKPLIEIFTGNFNNDK